MADGLVGLVIGSLAVATYYGDRFTLANRVYYASLLGVLIIAQGVRLAGL